MNEIFQFVYKCLKWISSVSGLTYHEVNIVVYFIIIPAIFIFLIGKLLKSKIWILGFGIFVMISLIAIPNFKSFSTTIFEKSVEFLNWFDKIGLNYIQASVIICVVVPILIIMLMILLNKRKTVNKIKNVP